MDDNYQNVPSSPGAYYINRLMTERVTNPGACFCHLEASANNSIDSRSLIQYKN